MKSWKFWAMNNTDLTNATPEMALEATAQGEAFVTTVGIVYELGKEALLFFGSEEATLGEFLTSTN